jgi:hypothetical protein
MAHDGAILVLQQVNELLHLKTSIFIVIAHNNRLTNSVLQALQKQDRLSV